MNPVNRSPTAFPESGAHRGASLNDVGTCAVKLLELRRLVRAIEVIPEVVWRMQTPSGDYCKEWRFCKYINPEISAWAHFQQENNKFPGTPCKYTIEWVEVLSDHGVACNQTAALLRHLAHNQSNAKRGFAIAAALDAAQAWSSS